MARNVTVGSYGEYEQRIRTIETHLIDGDPVGEIAALAAENFGVTVRQAWRYIAEVRRRWAASGRRLHRERESLISYNKAVRRREELFRAAKEAGDIGNALAVERDRCKLEGLYPTASNAAPGNANGTGVFIHVDGDAAIALRTELLDDPEYLEFQRHRALADDAARDAVAGPVRADGERGALEAGPAPAAS